MFWKKLDAKHLLILITLLALSLRLYGINWDAGQHLHPDERYMTMVATAVEWPSSIGEYLNPQTSPLSPYNTDYKAYIYGTFPLFWVKASADLVGWGDYGHLHIVGRLWSALFDIGTLLLIFWIGKHVFTRRVGLLAAAFYSFAVLAIQQSHFFTVDNFATFWIMASLAVLLRTVLSSRLLPSHFVGLGIVFGLAVASKISSLLFGGVIGLGLFLKFVFEVKEQKKLQTKWFLSRVTDYGLQTTIFLLTTYVAFRLVQPYAFADASWLDFRPQPDFWRALNFQRDAMAGEIMFPPNYQWVNTTPYWFPLKNLMLWGLGLPLGVAVLAGFCLLLFKLLKSLRNLKGQEHKVQITATLQILPLAWPVGLFLYNGGNFVKTMRYFLPAIPFLVLIAAYALDRLQRRASTPDGCTLARLGRIGVLAGSLWWALAYVNIYSADTTRVAASKWIYNNVPAGSVLANEHWDDGLPLMLPVKETRNSTQLYNGSPRRMTVAKLDPAIQRVATSNDSGETRNYENFQMEVYNPDLNPKGLASESKVRQLYNDLQKADYVILSSPRASGSIGQLPEQFPVMTRYYELLKNERLGFKRAVKITSYPNLLGVTISDESAEEAFWVYDHPPVEIYKKVNLPNYDRFASLFTILGNN